MFYIIVSILCVNDTMIFVIVQTEDNLASKQNDKRFKTKLLKFCSVLYCCTGWLNIFQFIFILYTNDIHS